MKRFRRITLLLLLSLLLQGCVSKSAQNEPPKEAAAVEAAESEKGAAVEETKPELRRTPLFTVISGSPTGLESACFAEVYETLYDKAQPLLAAGEVQHESGEDSYLIPLRSDILDSEGRPFGAKDAALAYSAYGEKRGDKLLTAAEVSENGELLLRFERELSAAEAEQWFSTVPLYTSAGETEADGSGLLQIYGTGPYKVSEQTGESLTLSPNEYYRNSEGCQNVANIRYLFLTEPADQVIALETFKADAADCLRYEDTEDFRDGGSYADLFATENRFSGVNRYLLPNVEKGKSLFDEERRLALFSVLDCAALADEMGGRSCNALGNPDLADLGSIGESYQSSVATGSGKGESLTLLCRRDGEGERIARSIREQLETKGYTITLSSLESAEYEEALQGSDWDLALVEIEGCVTASECWVKLWNLGGKPNRLRGGQSDATLLNLLQSVSKSDTATAENRERLQERVYNHAYALALPQLNEPLVYRRSLKKAVMNGSGALLPGSCQYE